MAVELNKTTSSTYSETDASNTAASPNGWPSGTYPNQVEANNRTTLGALQRFWNRANGGLTVGGTANAITLTPSNTSYPTSYVTGELYQFKASYTNTGTTTININGVGVVNIYKQSASGPAACSGGEIESGQNVLISYDGTEFQLLSYPSNLSTLASPAFTGTPTAPTATAGTSTTQIATTAFVNSTALTLASGTTATTQSAGDNSTKVATTAYANTAAINVFSSQNVVTGSRSLGSNYHNTTGKTMFITVFAYNNSNPATITAYTDSSTSPTTVVGQADVPGSAGASISFMVLSGNYYQVANVGSNTVLGSWTEWY